MIKTEFRSKIEHLYGRTLMTAKGTKLDHFKIKAFEYYLYPDFRKVKIPFNKIFKWTLASSFFYLFFAVLLNNFILQNTAKNKDEELKRSYLEISKLYTDSKSIVFNECLDSMKNSKEYIRYLIYQNSGIVIPKTVPENHLVAIKKNAEKAGIPLSIYVKVIRHESRFDSSAHNPSGAHGYMQMMPGTFKHFYEILSLKGGNTALNNLKCGSQLLKQNYDYWYKKKKDPEEAWRMALACYAMGDSLPRALGRVPAAVEGYVNHITHNENF